MNRAARHVALVSLGWVLVVAGVAALVLPGPGLLMIFAGLTVLSQHYEWAERRLRPIELRAMRGAAESVETLPRTAMAVLFALAVLGTGVIWIVQPRAPGWWPFAESWWLPGDVATGTTLVGSGVIALVLIAWSFRRFHGRPEELHRIEQRFSQDAARPSRKHPAAGQGVGSDGSGPDGSGPDGSGPDWSGQ